MKLTRINPHMAVIFLGLTLFFYHYYNSALSFNHFVINSHLRNTNPLIFIITLAPFTLSSVGSPIGGILITYWQSKTRNYVFPYLFLFDSILKFVSNTIIDYINHPAAQVMALGCRVLQGVLIGGLLPQYVIYFYSRSHDLQQRVGYSTLFFIIFYLCVMLSVIIVNFTTTEVNSTINWCISIAYFLLAIVIFRYKNAWHNFNIEGVEIDHSWSFIQTVKRNKWTIIRFACFITFMASINGFFLTVMPFFLIHYLNYAVQDVFIMQIIIMFIGILGFIFGSVYHRRIGRKVHLTIGLIIKLLMLVLFKMYMNHSLFWIEFIGAVCLFCFGVMAAKILLMLNSVFSAKSRLHGVAFTYNISWGLMFGFFGFLTMHLIEAFHNLYIPSLLIMFFSYISLISLWFTPDKDFFRYLEQK